MRVNGNLIKNPDSHIDEEKDVVVWKSNKINYEPFVYYILHKPAGIVSAVTDNIDTTVVDLLKKEGRKDLFPVGRLDKDTEGFLIITNDGTLAHNLLSPKKHVAKT